jgi:hypothetical protein
MSAFEQLRAQREELLARRRSRYTSERRALIELGILPQRPVGRPRLRPPDEALAVAKQQKRASQLRTRELVRVGIARLREQQLQPPQREPSASDPDPELGAQA